MKNETDKLEHRLQALTPLRLSRNIKLRIVTQLKNADEKRRSALARAALGFINVALPFGIAALFMATAGLQLIDKASSPPPPATFREFLVCATNETGLQNAGHTAGNGSVLCNSILPAVLGSTNITGLLN